MENLYRYLVIAIMTLLVAGCGVPSGTPQPPVVPVQISSPPLIAASPTPVPPTPVPTPTLGPLGEIQPIPAGYIFLGDPDRVALGFNMSAGGAIGRLRYRNAEFVDHADYGRYIQFSPYDGDDAYRCSDSACFVDWGWNPLQAGSADGYAAKVQEFRRWDDGLYIKAAGQEWAKNKPGSDVVYETWAWDHGGYFEIHTRMTHMGTDTHAPAGAEAPAAYFGAAIPLEYGYTGIHPFQAEPVQQYQLITESMSNNTNPHVYPSESWMAFGNSQGLGLIMALPPQPKLTNDWSVVFIRGAYPQPIGYIAPFAFIHATPSMTYDLVYYLIPGPIEQGRALVYDLIPHTYWTFNLGTSEGWSDPGQTARVVNGTLSVELSPQNPLSSSPGLSFYGVQHPVVSLEFRPTADAQDLCLSFITLEDPAWDDRKSTCSEAPTDPTKPYLFDFSEDVLWQNGLVTQLRMTAPAPTTLEIDTMAVLRELHGWEFGNPPDADGWYALSQLEPLTAYGGSLSSRSYGEDPYMLSPYISVPAEFGRIEIRMRSSSSSDARFFFITEEDPEWGEDKALSFKVTGDGEYHVYIVDMYAVRGWQGLIRQLRLDPMGEPGEFAVDYIRLGPESK